MTVELLSSRLNVREDQQHDQRWECGISSKEISIILFHSEFDGVQRRLDEDLQEENT